MDRERQRKDGPITEGEICLKTVTYIIVLLIIFAVLGYDVYLASRTNNSDIVKPLVTILRKQTPKSVPDGIGMEWNKCSSENVLRLYAAQSARTLDIFAWHSLENPALPRANVTDL